MLALLVPGVGMGASDPGGGGGSELHLLLIMGVGRVIAPFIVLIQGVLNGR